MTSALLRRTRAVCRRRDDGSAIIEFTFLAIIVIVPLLYLVIGFSAVQRGIFAATAGAREAGRAMGTADDPATGMQRAQYAAELAVADQSVDLEGLSVGYAPAGSDCSAAGSYQPVLAPGERFVVCVTVVVRVPGLPDFIETNTATGMFVVERDSFRE